MNLSTYQEVTSYILSVHVYNETSNGPGKLILVGTSTTGQSVKWVGNILIDKNLQNISTVRFYKKPTLEVSSVLSPVLKEIGESTKHILFTGSFYTYAVRPEKDSNLLNQRNVEVDYRLFSKEDLTTVDYSASFNTQLNDTDITLMIGTIQSPYSSKNLSVNITSSYKIKDILNTSTIILNNPIYYKDGSNNDVVVNVIDGKFSVEYPYISYNTSSEASGYLTVDINGITTLVKQSYADIYYGNIKPFTGYVSRHKLYKRSLYSSGDFEVIADEPLSSVDLLQDKITLNKQFSSIGTFYNQNHTDRYWFVSGLLSPLTQSSTELVNAINIVCPTNYSSLNSLNNYVIAKNNSSPISRSAAYYAFNETEYSNFSGSSYDSNFILLRKDVNYILSSNLILYKDSSTTNNSTAAMEFYFTSSNTNISSQNNLVSSQLGLLKLGSVNFSENTTEKKFDKPVQFIFSVSADIYGTVIIVPRKCVATISNISIKPYGDWGFSPDIISTRIPFPVNIANETFEIKSELYDINSTLVYSDLRVIESFDVSGSSLVKFIPGMKDPSKTTFISGSLEISQSLLVGENAIISGSLTIKGAPFFTGISECNFDDQRFLAYNSTNGLVYYTNLNDLDHTNNDVITLKLFDKNTSTKHTYRLIPSVEGRNVYIPPETVGVTFLPSSNS